MTTLTASPTSLTFISSMATRALLADAAALHQQMHPQQAALRVTSVGGVDAARRVAAGETFDGVVLARNAIDSLHTGGHVRPGSTVDLVQSAVAAAVPAGHSLPDISTENALRLAVLEAPSVGYSTGPSGTQLSLLFERWGIAQQVANKLVQAPAGVPVATLVARGEVALGFQQLSEMQEMPGISLLGELPAAVQIITTFSGAATASTPHAEQVHAILTFWQSPTCETLRQKHGMRACTQP